MLAGSEINLRSSDPLPDLDIRLVAFYHDPFSAGRASKRGQPRDVGRHISEHPDDMKQQARLARLYGIAGFCFTYPQNHTLEPASSQLTSWMTANIEFPFCVCCTNAAAIKNSQKAREFLSALLPALVDVRYLRVNGNPLVIILHPSDGDALCSPLREQAGYLGLPGLHICAMENESLEPTIRTGFDGIIEFPLRNFWKATKPSEQLGRFRLSSRYTKVDYQALMRHSVERAIGQASVYRGIVPSWNGPLGEGLDSLRLARSSPALFQYWLSRLVCWTRTNRASEERLIFLNAWNDQTVGSSVKPDPLKGSGYLEASFAALRTASSETELINAWAKRDGVPSIVARPASFGVVSDGIHLEHSGFDRAMRSVAARLIATTGINPRERGTWVYPLIRSVYRWIRRLQVRQ